MGDTYRVTIVRETGSGGEFESETLFEVAGGIGLVARIAPGALVDALRAADEEGVPDAGALADRVMDAAAAAGAPVAPSSHPFQGEQPKRKRRTKAEIAADAEAQAAGYRDAAHRAEVEAQQQAAATATGPALPEMTPDGPIVPEQSTAPAANVPADVAALAPSAAALAGGNPTGAPAATAHAPVETVPFNPFEVK
jgi:hypothetical protein